jgi:short-subunit dehydrogenase
MALCSAFLPVLKKSKGHIINISSIAGLLGVSYRTVYSASKFAVTGFSRALRAEVHPYGM